MCWLLCFFLSMCGFISVGTTVASRFFVVQPAYDETVVVQCPLASSASSPLFVTKSRLTSLFPSLASLSLGIFARLFIGHVAKTRLPPLVPPQRRGEFELVRTVFAHDVKCTNVLRFEGCLAQTVRMNVISPMPTPTNFSSPCEIGGKAALPMRCRPACIRCTFLKCLSWHGGANTCDKTTTCNVLLRLIKVTAFLWEQHWKQMLTWALMEVLLRGRATPHCRIMR